LRKNLKLLDELQTIDLKNDGFSEEKEGLLNGLAELDAELIGGRDAVAAKKEELTFLKEEREKLEEGIAAEQDNIRRSEAHQKEIKTQKEYQAVSKEIAAAKKLGAELEEQLLQKIGQIDELTAAIAGIEETLMTLEQQVNIRKNELQEKIDRLEAELDSGMVAREAIVKGLPASVTRRYGILREQRRGVAVVEAREGSCLGCNMQLPPQLYNTLFRADELILCPHCQRILILR